jgi:iron complex outermembrane recepter protein
MQKIKYCLLPAVFLILFDIPSWAFDEQNDVENVSYILEEITKTADRFTQETKTEIVVSEPGDQARTSDTASLLKDVPGVSLYGAGGVSSLPVIHGLADDRIRIKVDGMDLIASCPNHMNSPLSYIDPTSISSIKVYAGISPVSVGGDSIGGAIVAETQELVFAATGQGSLLKGEVGGFYRSNGNANGANLSATFASESVNLTYLGAIAKADNYKAGGDFKTISDTGRPGRTLPLDEVGSTAYKTTNHTLNIALKNDKRLIEAKLGYQDIPYELYPNQRMDMLENIQHSYNLHYFDQFNWGTFEARAYYEKVDHYMDFGEDKQFIYGAAPYVVATGMPMYTKGRTTGASFKAEMELTNQDLLRVGGEYMGYRLDDWWPPSPADLTGMLFSSTMPVPATFSGMAPDTFMNINDGKRDRLGIFTEWDASWSPQWFTQIGVRAEQVKMNTGPVQGYNNSTFMIYVDGYRNSALAFNALDRKHTDNNLDFTAMAKNTPNGNITIEFGFAQKTRSPNLYERYSWSRNAMALIMNNFIGDGNGYLGNNDLKPEKAHTFSVTGDLHSADQTQQLVITSFYTRVTDYIDAVQWNRTTNMAGANTPQQFGILKFMNQSARLYGLDVSGRIPLGATSIGVWGLKGLIKYINGKNLDTDDDLYNIMPLNAKITLTHKIGGWDNAIEYEVVKAKEDISAARQEFQTPGYSLVNMSTSYTWKIVRLDLGIENLFNKLYYLPLGGAYTGQGMTMSLNGIPWGISVPGIGRSFYTGLNIKF